MEDKLIPRYKLLKEFPGMEHPVGTIFYEERGWFSLCTKTSSITHNTQHTVYDFFEPYVGKFFEKL